MVKKLKMTVLFIPVFRNWPGHFLFIPVLKKLITGKQVCRSDSRSDYRCTQPNSRQCMWIYFVVSVCTNSHIFSTNIAKQQWVDPLADLRCCCSSDHCHQLGISSHLSHASHAWARGSDFVAHFLHDREKCAEQPQLWTREAVTSPGNGRFATVNFLLIPVFRKKTKSQVIFCLTWYFSVYSSFNQICFLFIPVLRNESGHFLFIPVLQKLITGKQVCRYDF